MRKEKSRVQSIAKRIFAGITVMMLSLVMVLQKKASVFITKQMIVQKLQLLFIHQQKSLLL